MSGPTHVKEVYSCELLNKKGEPSFEHMLIIENLNKVKVIQEKMGAELKPLKERQDLVTLHNKTVKEINIMIELDGTLDFEKFEKIITDIRGDLDIKMANELADLESKDQTDPKIQLLIEQLPAKYKPSFDFLSETLEMGTEIKKGGKLFTKDQKDRLVENIRKDMEDLSVQNDMQLNKVSRLNNETYECHQSARLMLKTIHDAFMALIRNWKS